MASEPETSTPLQPRKVLALVDFYLPGFKSGGPLRSVSNLVAWLGAGHTFYILTRDRDATDTRSYPGIMPDEWNDCGGARVYYASPGRINSATLRQCLREAAPDVVYLNSFFSTLTIRYLLLRRRRAVPSCPVVIAPRGELSPGALRLKRLKKRVFIALGKALGLFEGLRWQATAELERIEIQQVVAEARDIRVASNLPARVTFAVPATPEKRVGAMRLVFCSRIAEKKNLHALFAPLTRMEGEVDFDIHGPMRDAAYWARCEREIACLPARIRVRFCGELPHEQVAGMLARYHFFVLPTLSENFGHAIIEALAAGCPVLISDQTPWQDLGSQGVGWVVSVADTKAWEGALGEALALDEPAYRAMSNRARAYVAGHLDHPPVDASAALFADPFPQNEE